MATEVESLKRKVRMYNSIGIQVVLPFMIVRVDDFILFKINL